MNTLGKVLLAVGFTAVAGLLFVPQFPASPAQQMPGMERGATPTNEPTPTFHAQAPKDALPSTMDPSSFTDILTFNAYVVASHVKRVLYQQPCYCHCDRSQGHGSLLDCFVGRHGSGCDICQKEDFYSYEQTRKGKTPAQIRDGIMHGDWQSVDTVKYATAKLPLSNTPAK